MPSPGLAGAPFPRPAWRVPLRSCTLLVRLEALLFFLALAIILDVLIMPWALDTHPVSTLPMHGHIYRTVRVIRHASLLLRHVCSLILTALVAVTALAHECGHAAALHHAGAKEIEITLYGAGGSCRACASASSPMRISGMPRRVPSSRPASCCSHWLRA